MDSSDAVNKSCSRRKVASKTFNKRVTFTFCLCGLYPDEKGIPHHSDTVPTLNDVVVSISLGSPCVFNWREHIKII
jgi:alkylated DNA repair dioxygenase AlkB